MFIQLKSHKAHVFTKNDIDPSKSTIVMIPGAGMDHRTLSMFKLDKIKDDFNIIRSSNLAILGNSTFSWWASFLSISKKEFLVPSNFSTKEKRILLPKEIIIK